MKKAFLAVMVAELSLSLSLMSGADANPCPAETISMNVTTTGELGLMMTSINCTGQGKFDITWIASLSLVQTIELSNKKQVTVTGPSSAGATRDSSSLDPTDIWDNVIDAGGATGMFRVSNGSTLTLNNLVLEGGTSAAGAAIDARSSSSVYVDGCIFRNSKAIAGGETIHVMRMLW